MLHFFSNDSPVWSLRKLVQRMGGAWLEPRAGYMWQYAPGATPAATSGQTVGLMLDQTQQLALGPELAATKNTASGWTPYGSNTVTDIGGAVAITYVGGVNAGFGAYFFTDDLGLVPGKFYQVSFDGTINTGSASPYVNDGVTNIIFFNISTQSYTNCSCIIRVLGGGIFQINGNLSAGEVITLRNISFREAVSGFACQATAANRPTYQVDANSKPLIRHDGTDSLSLSLPAINVRRNFVNNSENLAGAGWEKLASGVGSLPAITPNYAPAPDGTPSADRVIFNLNGSLTGNTSRLYQNCVTRLGETVRKYRTLYIKTNDASSVLVYFIKNNNISSVLTINENWQRIDFSDDYATIGAYSQIQFGLGNGAETSVYADLSVWGVQLESEKITDYQRITDWTSEQYSSEGSVYFATPQGMSALHNQSMGTAYTLPAPNTDWYAVAVFPSRLKSQDERMLEKYMLRLAGLAAPDYLLDDMGNILTDDIGDPLLAG